MITTQAAVESGERTSREARTESVAVRFTKEEVKAVNGAAARQGLHPREWMRKVLLAALEQDEGDVMLVELTAQHMLLQDALGKILSSLGWPADQFDKVRHRIASDKYVQAKVVRAKHQAKRMGQGRSDSTQELNSGCDEEVRL